MTRVFIEMRSQLFTKRGHAKVMRFAFRNRMEFFRDQLLPTHFEVNELTRAGGAYGFARRTAKWMKKKAAAKGHQKPLVYRGNLRAAVLTNSTITATQHRGRFYARATYPLTDQRRKEIEIIIPGQRTLLASGLRSLYTNAASLPEFHDVKRQRVR
jgi:hypothetical protein